MQVIRGASPLSAALGELERWPSPTTDSLLSIPEIQVVKVGLSGCARITDWQTRWRRAFAAAHDGEKHLAAVIYADWRDAAAPPPDDILECACAIDCQYLLIDTWMKNSRSTLDILPRSQLVEILGQSKRSGMTTVLAGSIRPADLPNVDGLPVDVIAVRGAVCRSERTSAVEANRVCEFRAKLTELNCPPGQRFPIYLDHEAEVS